MEKYKKASPQKRNKKKQLKENHKKAVDLLKPQFQSPSTHIKRRSPDPARTHTYTARETHTHTGITHMRGSGGTAAGKVGERRRGSGKKAPLRLLSPLSFTSTDARAIGEAAAATRNNKDVKTTAASQERRTKSEKWREGKERKKWRRIRATAVECTQCRHEEEVQREEEGGGVNKHANTHGGREKGEENPERRRTHRRKRVRTSKVTNETKSKAKRSNREANAPQYQRVNK